MNKLLSPFNIGNVEIKNRIVMPPMCMYKAKDDNGKARCFHEIHYAARALGGVGLIIVEATAVEPRGRITNNDLGLWDDNQTQSHEKIVKQMHKFGAKTAVQLAHAGRKSECVNSQCVGASAVAYSPKYSVPKELSIDEIKSVKSSFINAAKRAQEAGYDAVEIHAAHGYLISSFLSPLSNLRKDEYGGSFENRTRLLEEIIIEMKKAVNLAIIVRFSAHEWENGGWDINESVKLSIMLEKLGVDAIDVSAGGNIGRPSLAPKIVPLYQADYAKAVKQAVKIPVIAVGLITKAVEAEALLRGEICDAVAFGRELLRNPNLAQFAMSEFDERDLLEFSYNRAF